MQYADVRERQLGQLFEGLVQKAPWVMVGVAMSVTAFFFLPVPSWRTWGIALLLLGGIGVIMPFIAYFARSSRALFVFQRLVFLGIFFHGTLIALTGGFDSPFLPIFVVVPVFAAALWREWRVVVWAPLLAVLCICLIGVAQMFGWLPSFTALAPPVLFPAAFVARGMVMAMLCLVAAFLCHRFIKVYERMAYGLWQTQQELLSLHKERLRSMEQLSRRMAHEVNNPLSAIKGLTQLLLRRGDHTGHLKVIEGEVARLQEILNAYLSFSRGTQHLEREALDLRQLLEELSLILEARLTEARTDLSLDALPATMPLEGDPGKLKQLLLNLLLNGIEAIEEASVSNGSAGVMRKIEIHGGVQGEGVSLVLCDNGPGFRAEWGPGDLARLCQPSVTSKADGTGLGLAVCASIIQAHGGTITLRDADEGGACVELWLPTKPPVVPEETERFQALEESDADLRAGGR